MKHYILLFLLSLVCFTSCFSSRKSGCSYSSKISNIRGHGIVRAIDSSLIIVVDGIVIQDDTVGTEIKTLLVKGDFKDALQSYVDRMIFFESRMFTYQTNDNVVTINSGKIERMNYVSSNGVIVFQKLH